MNIALIVFCTIFLLVIIIMLSDKEGLPIIGIICSVLIIGIIRLSLIEGYGRGYKNGTVDALTGKAKYELRTNPDSTKTWEEIK